ncbi:O-antigen polymerase [Acinetobacter variabilis]|uniref:O-antigen polymerase n=1 Tax=Acinetobacter variabilis TaxID=70346 RepID=UPI003AF61027
MDYSSYSLIMYICLTFLISFVFFIKGEPESNLKGQWLKHSNIFLIGYFVVHYQYYIDLLLGFQSIGNKLYVDNHLIIIKSLLISLIGLVCFYIGYFVSMLIRREKWGGVGRKYNTVILQFLSYLILIYYYIKVNPLYLNGGYNVFDQGAEAKYAALAFTATIYAIMIQKLRNFSLSNVHPSGLLNYLKLVGLGTIIPVIIYLLGVVLSGDRGPIIIFSLLYLSGYLILTKSKIKFVYIMVSLLVAGSFISLLGEARRIERGSGISLWEKITLAQEQKANYNNDEKNSIIPATQELSISISSLHYIVDYLSQENDYLYGKIQLNEAKLAIPLGAIIFNYENTPENRRYVNIQNYITWIAQGDSPSYGNGGTLVADLYSIFGVVSIIYGMFIFGWFVRVLEIRMFVYSSSNIIWQILPVIYFSEILYLSRSSILGSLKIIILVFLLLYLNRLFNSRN